MAGRRPLQDALADYERRRNAATRADYQQNLALAQFMPLSPEAQRLREALRDNPEATNRFCLAPRG